MTKLMFVPIALVAATPALAQRPAVNDYSANIGIGVAVRPSYDGSNDYVFGPGGIIRGKVAGFDIETSGPQVSVNLNRSTRRGGVKLAYGPVIGVNLNRANQIRDARVRTLGNIRAAAQLGGFVGIQKSGIITSPFDSLSFEVAYVHDVGTVHRSSIITPKIQYGTPLSQRTFVSLSASASIVGDDYATTYFAVSPAGSVASGLRPYALDGGIKDVGVTFVGAQSLGKDIRRGASLFAVAGYSRLLGDFKASPIVADAGSANQLFGAFGVGYSF